MDVEDPGKRESAFSFSIEFPSDEPEVQQIFSGPTPLGHLETVAIAAILQNCGDELCILHHVLPLSERELCENVPIYATLEERFGKDRIQEFDVIDHGLSSEKKFQKDLSMICFLLDKCCDEVESNGNFSVLTEVLNSIERMNADEIEFLSNYTLSKSQRIELKELINYERETFKKEIEKLSQEVYDMQVELAHREAIYHYTLIYLDKWEKVRQSQNRRLSLTAEEEYQDIIGVTEKNIKNEAVAHGLIKVCIEEQTEEYLEEIQKWSVAYEEEIERRDMEIYNLKSQREALAERFEALQNEYNLHKEAIDKWLAYKEQKRKEEEERLRLERAAIKIQAWWRGVMVRRFLGKFKKLKKKGKKGKGKKDKGKKAKGKGKGKK